jgi:glycosyltransferase involved in cell wall biosynthesis
MAEISVIVPVYNGARYLEEAIQSILSQEMQPREIIVVDDGSTDGSAELAGQYGPKGVRVHRKENGGAASARNLGMKVAVGDYFGFLDADDLWAPGKMAHQMAVMASDGSLDLVLGQVTQFLCPQVPSEQRGGLRKDLQQMPGYLVGSMLIRRESMEKVGPFNEALRFGEFIDWFDRARSLGMRHKILSETVLLRRIHDRNQGITQRSNHSQDYLAVVKAALDRRRSAK